jgi:hypothetical protein
VGISRTYSPGFSNQAKAFQKYARHYRYFITIYLLFSNMDGKLLDVALALMKTSG